MAKRETLTLPADELRFADDGEGTFTGYASLFGQADSFGDTIERGAFRKALKERRGAIPMFWNHNQNEPIGVWDELAEDERGLKVKGRLVTETVRGREAFELMKAKAVTGLSIGFRARSSKRGPNGARVLTDIDLVEVSVVSLPSASKARVTSVRNAGQPTRAAAFIKAVRRAATSLKG